MQTDVFDQPEYQFNQIVIKTFSVNTQNLHQISLWNLLYDINYYSLNKNLVTIDMNFYIH